MEIKISKNIGNFRKQNGYTQAQVAEYLSVSPQAVSKWEQGASIPDVYLLPQLAFLFNVSLDTLFGTSNIKTAELLVKKYTALKGDQNYKEAKEALETLLGMDEKSLQTIQLLAHLEYERAREYMHKSMGHLEGLYQYADGIDEDSRKEASHQMMRLNRMLGQSYDLEPFMEAFENDKSFDKMLDLLIVLEEYYQYDEMKRWGEDYLQLFKSEEKATLSLHLLEAAKSTLDEDFAKEAYQLIMDHTKNPQEVFSAKWKMWELGGLMKKKDMVASYRDELLEMLECMGFDEYTTEDLKRKLSE